MIGIMSLGRRQDICNGPKKATLLSLKPHNKNNYESASLAQLMAFCVGHLHDQGITATFETITIVAFKLFPSRFSLVGFEEHPDAARINRALLQSRPKYQNLIVGDVHKGYCLTHKGEHAAEQVRKTLSSHTQAMVSKKKVARHRTFTGEVTVNRIESTQLYRQWRENPEAEIDLYSIWLLLEVTPYTEKEIIRGIFQDFREAAEAAKRDDMLRFLGWIKGRYPDIIS